MHSAVARAGSCASGSAAAGTRGSSCRQVSVCSHQQQHAPVATTSASTAAAPVTVDRRAVLIAAPALLLSARAAQAKQASGDWSSPGLDAPIDPDAPKFSKTASGVRLQVLSPGSGPAAAPGSQVLFDYVLRRSNGYFIYGTIEGVSFQPKDVPVGPVSYKLDGDSPLIQGLQEVLVGLRPGAKVRALVPPAAGYTSPSSQPQPPTFASRRQLENHKAEPLLFELQLLRVDGAKA